MELIIDQKLIDLTKIEEGDIIIAQGKNATTPSAFMIVSNSFDQYSTLHMQNGHLDGSYSSALEAAQSFYVCNYNIISIYSKKDWNLKLVSKEVS